METDCPPGGTGHCSDGNCPFWVNGKCFPDKRLLEECDCPTWGQEGLRGIRRRGYVKHKRYECWKCMLYFKKLVRAKDTVNEEEGKL